MDRSSPMSNAESMNGGGGSPTSSAPDDAPRRSIEEAAVARKRKASRKKHLPTAMRAAKVEAATAEEDEADGDTNSHVAGADDGTARKIMKKPKPKRKDKDKDKEKDKDADVRPGKKPRKQLRVKIAPVEGGLTPAQMAVNEQMRRALEEDQYSANGSIVDTDSDDDDLQYCYKGQSVRLDRSYLVQAARKHLWLERSAAGSISTGTSPSVGASSSQAATSKEGTGAEGDDVESRRSRGSLSKKKKKGKRGKEEERGGKTVDADGHNVIGGGSSSGDNDLERDEGSIFGQTTGSSNSTWVECDKCKKWRRLRGVVDERKLPPKWYCHMNRNDPERARCSAPEEEYDAASTPESAADARTRKHLRVWVRRLQCNEAYESRQPTLTRGKKRATATSAKDPYEWIRCCNPSCGKWRAILKSMDAKTNVIERATDGEWYCVMNTWDEKVASCAAPQENIPAIGCPPWVIQG